MKKTVIYILGITLISFTFSNCGSSKKGCGLTSDAQKIEQTTTTQTSSVSVVK